MMDCPYNFNAPSFVNLAQDTDCNNLNGDERCSKREVNSLIGENHTEVNIENNSSSPAAKHVESEVQVDDSDAIENEPNSEKVDNCETSVNEACDMKMDCEEVNTGETEVGLDDNEEQMDDSHTVEATTGDLTNNQKVLTKTSVRRFGMEVDPSPRQSPRLIAISKEIRRRNANRGFLPPSAKGSRRRSLSEGANPLFSKVEKKPSIRMYEKPLGALTDVDEEVLSEIANISKSDSQNTTSRSIRNKFHYMKETISQRATKQTTKDKQVANTKAKDVQKGLTKVQPFKFSSSNKAKETPANEFVSLAELNMKFFNKTPLRFRTRSACSVQAKVAEKTDNKMIVPHTPRLMTKTRTRSNNHLTQKEIEDKEIEEAQQHKFKAKPLNKNILKSPNLPVAPKICVTVPTPFNIIDEKRKAVEISEAIICKQMMGSSASLASLPHGGLDFIAKKHSTIVKPFSFENRDLEAMKKKQEKIEMQLEERRKLADFHAQPMPYFETKEQGVPSAKPLPVTKVQPFNMKSETFRNSRLQKFKQQLHEQENEDKEKRRFQATVPVSTRKEPFVPELPHRTLDDISGFELNTAKRAEEREEFNIQVKHNEDQAQALKMEREEREQKEEEEEVRRLRKAIVHKAQPVHHYKSVDIKQGLLPVTCPKSPNLLTKKKEE